MERKMRGAATKKRLAAMLLAAAVAFTASALDCITDVMVVGGADESVADSYAEQGWTVIAQDLNAGCGSGSDYIYLLYRSADSASVSNGFITGFYIKTGAVSNELTHTGRGYHLAPCAGDDYFVKERQGDLNSNAGGDYVYMHVTTGELPYAPGVSYLDPTGSEYPEKVCHGYTFVTNQTTLTSGWYVVAGAVVNYRRITVSGDVNLILPEGAALAANGGIDVSMNDSITNSLTIWAQSTNAVAGKLTARGKDYADSIMVFRPRSRGRTW